MFKVKINTEEKTFKTEKHKKFTFTFEKKSSSFITYFLEWIKSLLKK